MSLRLRLVGTSDATKGLIQSLTQDVPTLIGRDPSCTVCVGSSDANSVSRHHAVIEWSARDGWFLYDAGSSNGTSLLKGGMPPTLFLDVSRRYSLAAGDIIEIAGPEHQFLVQVIPDSLPNSEATRLLSRPTRRAVQQLVDGHSVGAWDAVREEGFVSRTPRGSLRLGPADVDSLLMQFAPQGTDVKVTALVQGVRLNSELLAVGQAVTLRDKDLLIIDEAPGTGFLFLDPGAVRSRNLSDLLLTGQTVTIGTAADNACRLIDPSVSRHHAVIRREAGCVWIRDLESVNGTVVQGRRITGEYQLTAGERVWLGRVPLVADDACWVARPVRASVDIRFADVSVEIAGKLRLRNVSLAVGQGEMIGILGPSASGKSTLLRALAGHQGLVNGEIYVNGRSLSAASGAGGWFRSLLGFGPDTREIGFVQQIDLLQPGLKVQEILLLAARQMGLPSEEVEHRAERAASVCNLSPLLPRVAVSANGQLNLSGGQLKRVCVALEVLRQPRVLVLDEPTTGQDPKNTNDLMNLFRSLAQNGVTLLISTHDLRNLALFDKVVALCLGHLAFYGPPDQFPSYFGAVSAEEVYESLPDREDRLADAVRLADDFRRSPLYQQLCEVPS
jgi:ABC-type multidrug transport system ATPase subunit/pSer/pThr/pTyr-binding forkhead associated (FHA) protein